ncbi:uncharacterized protein LOC144136565 isoform X3 [Amblyomma americanum]
MRRLKCSTVLCVVILLLAAEYCWCTTLNFHQLRARRKHDACSKINQRVCEKLDKKCVSYDGTDACVGHLPTWCTEQKKDECRTYQKVCDDSNGVAQCVDPASPVGAECYLHEKENCKKEGKECQKKSGQVHCIARSKSQTCSKRSLDVCKKLGKNCVSYDGTDVCVDETPTWCTREKQDECREFLKVCDDSSGVPQCMLNTKRKSRTEQNGMRNNERCLQSVCRKFSRDMKESGWRKQNNDFERHLG